MNLSLPQQKVLNWLGFALIFVSAIAGIVILQKPRLAAGQQRLSAAEYRRQEQQEKIQLNLMADFPSLGAGNLWADWLYLRFIQYFGDSPARETIGYSLSPDYFQAVVDRDPRFVDANLKLATATSIFAGAPQRTVALLGQSLQSVSPQQVTFTYPPYFLWIYKGVDELLFLGDIQEAKRSYQQALNWAEKSDDPRSQSIAQRMRESIQFLQTNPKSKSAQIGAWSVVLSNGDPQVQRRAIDEIKALGGEVFVTPDGRLNVRVPPGID